ncbi:MAG: sigma 54-interacting transcriptional regulator [Acidobacteriota bacterium]
MLLRERDRLVASWYASYSARFVRGHALPAPAFAETFGRDFEELAGSVLHRDFVRFEASAAATGRALLSRGIPLVDVIATIHLFEEAAAPIVAAASAADVPDPGIDKLCHARLMIFAATYFATDGGLAPTAFHGLVGASGPMRGVWERIAAAAAGRAPVLFVGEPGTGKRLAARVLHEHRGDGSTFAVIDCRSLRSEGVGALAGGSEATVLLDEIADLPRDAQERLAASMALPGTAGSDRRGRLLATTRTDPAEAVASGKVARALADRIAIHRIDLPPLRDRAEDIPALVSHFVDAMARRGQRRVETIEPEALFALSHHRWPGNVRELEDVVAAAVSVGNHPSLRALDLPAPLRPAPADAALPTLAEAEVDLIRRALQATGNNKVQAARMLRISRHRLYDKLRRVEGAA